MPGTKHKVRKETKGETVYKPDNWIFKEYNSLLTMYMGNAPFDFDPEEIKKIKVTKQGTDSYVIKGFGKKTYTALVAPDSIKIKIQQNKKLLYEETLQ